MASHWAKRESLRSVMSGLRRFHRLRKVLSFVYIGVFHPTVLQTQPPVMRTASAQTTATYTSAKRPDIFVRMKDRILELAANDLITQHRCHTVVLYGSRSRGDWTEESDYDLIGFRDDGAKFRDARVIEGKYLDAFVYPVTDVIGHEEDFLRIRKGTILIQKDGFAEKLFEKLELIFDKGPKPLPEDELHAMRVWIQKMLSRIARNDIEGCYRRAWLQYELIETYFALRKKWYLGPKESFRWLSDNDPAAHALFDLALKPGATLADIQRLAEKVLAT